MMRSLFLCSPDTLLMRRQFFFLAIIFTLTSCSASGDAPVCLMGAHLGADGYCRAQRAPVHKLPFRPGYQTQILQGFYGVSTHEFDREGLAIDFSCEEGDPIVATRSGRVLEVREDSRRGCPDPSCYGYANHLTIDHGDGTYSQYGHLKHFGALVEPGEKVCRGEIIGLCGSTGYAGGPHLHYALRNSMNWTIPVQFLESIEQKGFGFPAPRASFISTNERLSQCKDTRWSSAQRGAFAHHGIILDDELDLVIDPTESPTQTISGTYHGDMTHVAVHRKPDTDAEWLQRECVPVRDGKFEIDISWSSQKFTHPSYFFVMTGSDARCETTHGWAWSYRIHRTRTL